MAAAIRDYDKRKAEARRVLEEVLAEECEKGEGPLVDILSEGFRKQTGRSVDAGMVSDFLSEISERWFPDKPKGRRKQKKRATAGPRPVAVVSADGEQAVSGGWAGALRHIASVVADDNPGRADVWTRLSCIQPELPPYMQDISSNVEATPGLWLNSHGSTEAVQRKIREVLDAFDYPLHKWRLRLKDGTLYKL